MNTKTSTAEVVEQRMPLESLKASVSTRVSASVDALVAGVVPRITVLGIVTEAIESGEIQPVDEQRYRAHVYSSLRKKVYGGELRVIRGRTGGFSLPLPDLPPIVTSEQAD